MPEKHAPLLTEDTELAATKVLDAFGPLATPPASAAFAEFDFSFHGSLAAHGSAPLDHGSALSCFHPPLAFVAAELADEGAGGAGFGAAAFGAAAAGGAAFGATACGAAAFGAAAFGAAAFGFTAAPCVDVCGRPRVSERPSPSMSCTSTLDFGISAGASSCLDLGARSRVSERASPSMFCTSFSDFGVGAATSSFIEGSSLQVLSSFVEGFSTQVVPELFQPLLQPPASSVKGFSSHVSFHVSFQPQVAGGCSDCSG